MLPSINEIEYICGVIGTRARWRAYPLRWVLEECLDKARKLNDDSGDPKRETAALFYAFARDEGRLGQQASLTLAPRLAIQHARDMGLVLAPGAWREMLDLKDKVAEGDADFERVRSWFTERLVSALTQVKTRGQG